MSTTSPASAPVSNADPFSDAFLADPYPFHHTLRELGPVFRLDHYGVWGMARHEHVIAALVDWNTYASGAGVGLQDLRKGKAWRPPSIVLEADPPLHDETRGAMSRILSGPVVRQLRPAFEAEAERLADELVARGTFDAVADLAVAYPLKVVGDAVGVPPEGRECLLPFGNMLFNSFGPANDIFLESTKAAGDAVLKQIYAHCERGALASGGLGLQVYQAADEGRLKPEYAPVLVRSMLSAGFDTTVCGLGSAFYAFAAFPEQWQILRSSPQLHRTAFDEVLRWESPVQTFFRTTTKPVNIGGVRLGADEKILLFLGAANRDPRRWDTPEQLDVTRNTSGHVALGQGIHVCVGQMIARLEAELLFSAFAKRVARFELAGEPLRRRNNSLRGFAALPMKVVRA
jgi:cytochrome P450